MLAAVLGAAMPASAHPYGDDDLTDTLFISPGFYGSAELDDAGFEISAFGFVDLDDRGFDGEIRKLDFYAIPVGIVWGRSVRASDSYVELETGYPWRGILPVMIGHGLRQFHGKELHRNRQTTITFGVGMPFLAAFFYARAQHGPLAPDDNASRLDAGLMIKCPIMID